MGCLRAQEIQRDPQIPLLSSSFSSSFSRLLSSSLAETDQIVLKDKMERIVKGNVIK